MYIEPEKMGTLENKVDNSVDLVILAAKQLGFDTPQLIEANFNQIIAHANNVVNTSRNRIVTALVDNPAIIETFAARYQLKVK